QEEAGDPSPTPRFTADEVLEDPDTMEPVLPTDKLVDEAATSEENAGLMATEESQVEEEPEIAELVIEGEKEVPEEALTEELETMNESGGDDLVSMVGADEHPDASDFITADEPSGASDLMAAEDGAKDSAEDDAGETDVEFDSLFSSMQEEIAAHPDGEHLDDLLRIEGIRERVAALDFALPQNESPFSRAMGIYALAGEAGESAYPSAMWGAESVSAQPVAGDVERDVSAAVVPTAEFPPAMDAPAVQTGVGLESSSLLDADIRNKLGAVLDEIISVSVRKAVQEEMPKLMERMSKET
ncbi:MAG: hypothetical protein V3S64_14335, partial [bacterium]